MHLRIDSITKGTGPVFHPPRSESDVPRSSSTSNNHPRGGGVNLAAGSGGAGGGSSSSANRRGQIASATSSSSLSSSSLPSSSSSSSFPWPGLVMNWNQNCGRLATSGNCGTIKLWNVNSEQLTSEINIGRSDVVTSMYTDDTGDSLIAADIHGVVRMFDLRQRPKMGAVLYQHGSPVVKAAMQRTSARTIVSASHGGEVFVCDLRAGHPRRGTANGSSSSSGSGGASNRKKTGLVLKLNAHEKFSLDAFAVHEYAPVVATGSKSQHVTIVDLRNGGKRIKHIRYHEGFLGQRLGPVTCLDFHRHELLLAAGCRDVFVSTYSGKLAD